MTVSRVQKDPELLDRDLMYAPRMSLLRWRFAPCAALTMLATATVASAEVRPGVVAGVSSSSFYDPTDGHDFRPFHAHVQPLLGVFARWTGWATPGWYVDAGIRYTRKAPTYTSCGVDDCTGLDLDYTTWRIGDIELPMLLGWSHATTDTTRAHISFGLMPLVSVKAVAHTVSNNNDGTFVFDEEIYRFRRYDIAADVGAGFDVRWGPAWLAIELRGSAGLLNRIQSEESPATLHGYGLYLLISAMYDPVSTSSRF